MIRKSLLKSFVAIFAMLALVLVSCEKDAEVKNDLSAENLEVFTDNSLNESVVLEDALGNNDANFKCASPAEICGDYKFYPLIASKRYYAGAAIVYNDKDNLYVTLISRYRLTDFHLFVGDKSDFPLNNGNNPQIGQFPYKDEAKYGMRYKTFTVPLKDIPECYTMAIHATYRNHTIWAKDCRNSISFAEAFGSNRWGWIMKDCVEKCKEEKYLVIKTVMKDTVLNRKPNTVLYDGTSPFASDWCSSLSLITPENGGSYKMVFLKDITKVAGTVSTAINGSNLNVVLTATAQDLALYHSYVFYGTETELDAFIEDGNTCPTYVNFPHQSQGTVHQFEIPVD